MPGWGCAAWGHTLHRGVCLRAGLALHAECMCNYRLLLALHGVWECVCSLGARPALHGACMHKVRSLACFCTCTAGSLVGAARGVRVQSRFCCEALVCLQAGSGAGLARGVHVQARDLLAVSRIYVSVCKLGGGLALYG